MKSYSTKGGQTQKRRLHQASKSIFSLAWPWSLTFWPPKLTVSCPWPTDLLCQLASKSVREFSDYRVGKCDNGQTDGRTHERTDGQTDERMDNPRTVWGINRQLDLSLYVCRSCVLCLFRQVQASNDANLLYHELFSLYVHIPHRCSSSSLSS